MEQYFHICVVIFKHRLYVKMYVYICIYVLNMYICTHFYLLRNYKCIKYLCKNTLKKKMLLN